MSDHMISIPPLGLYPLWGYTLFGVIKLHLPWYVVGDNYVELVWDTLRSGKGVDPV